MFGWAKQQMANVVGTAEPIHGPTAIHSVAKQAATTPYTETTKADVKWLAKSGTSVETQSFYLMTEGGHLCLVQVIYSCVGGLKTTCQFNTKIFYPEDQKKPHLWSSDALSNVEFSNDRNSFYAKDVAVELNAAGDAYTIKSMTNQASIVNITVSKAAPGFQVGADGTTKFGFKEKEPWGAVRHVFWPRNKVEGTIMTKEGPIDVKGRALFIHALQDMKPHHAAAKWSFCDFAGDKYSAIMMEFTTPPSYASTVVNVGGIVSDSEVIMAGSSNTVAFPTTTGDAQNDWPEPTSVKFAWDGKTKDGKPVSAVIEGSYGDRLDKVDVMAEVPKFVKQIVAGAVGTKPYIYQYGKPMTLKLKIGDEEVTEQGRLFSEATFISA